MLRSFARRFADSTLLTKHARSYCRAGGVNRLEGKVAVNVITGGASGLGRATAHEFIQNGAQVIIADIDSSLGPQVAKDFGPSAHFVKCDVAEESQVEKVVQIAMSGHGKLDIMYNNAGITGPSFPPSIADLDLEEFDKVMSVNVRGTMAGIKHAARVMIPIGSGSILCTSSISGLMGGLGSHSYTVSKLGIPGIVKSVANELCWSGVRVNCISPGPIPTQQTVTQIGLIYPEKTEEEIVGLINALGGLKGPQCEEMDVAKAALYLASDEEKYITGHKHNLVVDGGFTSFKNLPLPLPSQVA